MGFIGTCAGSCKSSHYSVVMCLSWLLQKIEIVGPCNTLITLVAAYVGCHSEHWQSNIPTDVTTD